MPAGYMPSAHAPFVTWIDAFTLAINTTHTPAGYGLTAAEGAAIAASVALANASFALVGTRAAPGTARTPANIAANDAQLRATRALLRPFATFISANAGIADAWKTQAGVTIRSTSKVRVPPPASQCIVTPVMTVAGQVLMKLADENTPLARIRPYGTVGAELHTIAAAVAPVSAAVIPYTKLATRFRQVLDTDPGDVGKQLYIAARWVNRHGEPGPFGPVVSIIIG